eukprot:g1852.t1
MAEWHCARFPTSAGLMMSPSNERRRHSIKRPFPEAGRHDGRLRPKRYTANPDRRPDSVRRTIAVCSKAAPSRPLTQVLWEHKAKAGDC